MTILCADPPKADPLESRHRATSLSSFDSGSSSSSHFSSSSIGSTSSIAPTPSSILVSSYSPATILTTRDPATFKFPIKLSPTVNLRGFNLQAVKYASISDIVIYGKNGVDENVVDLARRVGEAMEAVRRERRAKGQGREERYNIYIVEGESLILGMTGLN